MRDRFYNYYKVLGPGLLSAGAAIGVSHLVQSTRAGAEFGFQLIWVVVAANLIKYPFFEMAPRYTAATGESLLRGYLRLGRWTLWVVLFMTLGTMFIVQAAVTIVTAGIAVEFFNIPVNAKVMSLIMLMSSAVILISGKYSLLDNLVKAIVLILTATTLASLTGALTADQVMKATNPFNWDDKVHLFFLVGLAGWMPAPMDLSVWHSIWIEEKGRQLGGRVPWRSTMIDFHVGYIGTTVLAVCFLLLGALIMHGSGESFADQAAVFAGQLISLYTKSLGDWSYPIIGIAAFLTMFSTTLTCLDAFPRVLRETLAILFDGDVFHAKSYNLWLIVTVCGALILLFYFVANMKEMVGVATTLSFVLTPVYAIFNYRLLRKVSLPPEAQMSRSYRWLCLVFIMGLLMFSVWFLCLKYF